MYKDLLRLIVKDETGIKNIKNVGEQFTYAEEDDLQMVVSPYGKIVNDGGMVKAVSKPNPSPIEAIRFYEHVRESLPQGFSGDLDHGVDIRYVVSEPEDKVHVIITGHMD